MFDDARTATHNNNSKKDKTENNNVVTHPFHHGGVEGGIDRGHEIRPSLGTGIRIIDESSDIIGHGYERSRHVVPPGTRDVGFVQGTEVAEDGIAT